MYWTEGDFDGSPVDRLVGAAPSEDTIHRPEPALHVLLGRLRSALQRPFDARVIYGLRQRIIRQSSFIRRAEAALTSIQIFERASLAARMGVWQCDLASNRLTWSKGTYDLFGLPRSSQLARSDILRSYSEESLARLERVRHQAIAADPGFGLDAEIRTPGGENRWIRISATVERRNGEPVRLFGIKQDVTEEKRLLARMSYLAEHDAMTGLANRTQFDARFSEICKAGGPGGALMLIDLDGFKEVNDTFGHAVGDECLVEMARRLSALCQSAELVSRIGGDEFAVLFGPTASMQKLEAIAGRIREAAEAPLSCSGRSLRVGASIGFACTEGQTPAAVFARADSALYGAKAAGRRTYKASSRALSCP